MPAYFPKSKAPFPGMSWESLSEDIKNLYSGNPESHKQLIALDQQGKVYTYKKRAFPPYTSKSALKTTITANNTHLIERIERSQETTKTDIVNDAQIRKAFIMKNELFEMSEFHTGQKRFNNQLTSYHICFREPSTTQNLIDAGNSTLDAAPTCITIHNHKNWKSCFESASKICSPQKNFHGRIIGKLQNLTLHNAAVIAQRAIAPVEITFFETACQNKTFTKTLSTQTPIEGENHPDVTIDTSIFIESCNKATSPKYQETQTSIPTFSEKAYTNINMTFPPLQKVHIEKDGNRHTLKHPAPLFIQPNLCEKATRELTKDTKQLSPYYRHLSFISLPMQKDKVYTCFSYCILPPKNSALLHKKVLLLTQDAGSSIEDWSPQLTQTLQNEGYTILLIDPINLGFSQKLHNFNPSTSIKPPKIIYLNIENQLAIMTALAKQYSRLLKSNAMLDKTSICTSKAKAATSNLQYHSNGYKHFEWFIFGSSNYEALLTMKTKILKEISLPISKCYFLSGEATQQLERVPFLGLQRHIFTPLTYGNPLLPSACRLSPPPITPKHKESQEYQQLTPYLQMLSDQTYWKTPIEAFQLNRVRKYFEENNVSIIWIHAASRTPETLPYSEEICRQLGSTCKLKTIFNVSEQLRTSTSGLADLLCASLLKKTTPPPSINTQLFLWQQKLNATVQQIKIQSISIASSIQKIIENNVFGYVELGYLERDEEPRDRNTPNNQ